MEIALWTTLYIAGYFAVGFVTAFVCVSCDWYPRNNEDFIATLTIFVWPIFWTIGLFMVAAGGAIRLGKRCRTRRSRRLRAENE